MKDREYQRLQHPAGRLDKAEYLLPLLAVALVLAAASLLFRGEKSIRSALGESLAVEGIFLLALSWFAHLRKDGVRLLGRKGASESGSWRERIPELGKAPPPPSPIPGPKGPQDPAYLRLVDAEERLRRRIAGNADESQPEEESEGKGGPRRAQGLAVSALSAGGILLAAAVCLQYL